MDDTLKVKRTTDFFDKDLESLLAALRNIDKALEYTNGYNTALQARLNAATNQMVSACRDLEQELGDDNGLIEDAKTRFREAISPWFSQSVLMSRGLNKPSGHPGDFETLEAIYDNRPLSSGIGFYLDQYFLHSPLAVAVRNRKDWIRDALSETLNNGTGFGGG